MEQSPKPVIIFITKSRTNRESHFSLVCYKVCVMGGFSGGGVGLLGQQTTDNRQSNIKRKTHTADLA